MARFPLLLAVLFAGCAGLKVAPEQRVLVFGAIRAPEGVDKVWIQRDAAFLKEDVSLDEAGNFALIDAAPGAYFLAGYYAYGVLHSFGDRITKQWFIVEPGELKFLGSYRVGTTTPEGFLRVGTFELRDAKEDPAAILRALLPRLEKTQWGDKVRGTLKSAPGAPPLPKTPSHPVSKFQTEN